MITLSQIVLNGEARAERIVTRRRGNAPGETRRDPMSYWTPDQLPPAAEMRATANENDPDLVPANVEISDAEDFLGISRSAVSVCHFPGGVIISGFTYGNEPVDVHLAPAVAREFAAAILRDADAADGVVRY